MAIKKSLLLLLALAILPLSVKAEPNAPTGFSVTGTYKLVASTPGGLTGKGYLTYKTPSDFANMVSRL
jgi:hypothetical protein